MMRLFCPHDLVRACAEFVRLELERLMVHAWPEDATSLDLDAGELGELRQSLKSIDLTTVHGTADIVEKSLAINVLCHEHIQYCNSSGAFSTPELFETYVGPEFGRYCWDDEWD